MVRSIFYTAQSAFVFGRCSMGERMKAAVLNAAVKWILSRLPEDLQEQVKAALRNRRPPPASLASGQTRIGPYGNGGTPTAKRPLPVRSGGSLASAPTQIVPSPIARRPLNAPAPTVMSTTNGPVMPEWEDPVDQRLAGRMPDPRRTKK
ncbi:MAG: hypothetical protein Q7S66_00520 [bacterium]|nr:hypothetical protein [bacterium]